MGYDTLVGRYLKLDLLILALHLGGGSAKMMAIIVAVQQLYVIEMGWEAPRAVVAN